MSRNFLFIHSSIWSEKKWDRQRCVKEMRQILLLTFFLFRDNFSLRQTFHHSKFLLLSFFVEMLHTLYNLKSKRKENLFQFFCWVRDESLVTEKIFIIHLNCDWYVASLRVTFIELELQWLIWDICWTDSIFHWSIIVFDMIFAENLLKLTMNYHDHRNWQIFAHLCEKNGKFSICKSSTNARSSTISEW